MGTTVVRIHYRRIEPRLLYRLHRRHSLLDRIIGANGLSHKLIQRDLLFIRQRLRKSSHGLVPPSLVIRLRVGRHDSSGALESVSEDSVGLVLDIREGE